MYMLALFLQCVGSSEPFTRVLRQGLDDGGVKGLDFPLEALVSRGQEVDGKSFPAVPATATNAVNVVLLIPGQIVVDHSSDSLNICNNIKTTYFRPEKQKMTTTKKRQKEKKKAGRYSYQSHEPARRWPPRPSFHRS